MSLILAIDTSSDLASAALLHGQTMLVREAAGAQTHSHAILPLVQSLLAEAGCTLAQCDAIGFDLGPGSFTGVRTACGIAQGLAFGAGLPLVPVVSLLAMAEQCRIETGANEVLAVLDARMGEVYWAQYRFRAGWQVIIEPTLSAPGAVRPQSRVRACGNGLAAYADRFIGQSGPEEFMADALSGVMPHARAVARLAQLEFSLGKTITPAQAQPLYLRNKVALTTNERMARMAS